MTKFRKEIIRLGRYVLPSGDGEIDVTEDRIKEWLEATQASGVKTWVPYRHSQDPRDNCGFIDGFEFTDGILYGEFNITDDEAAEKINEGTIQDVSIGVGKVVTEDGTTYAEVIKHVALVMDPHLREQEGFKAMEAAEGGFCFSASDRVKENFLIKLAYKIGLLNGRTKGGENLDAKELNEKVEGLTVRLEAAEADRLKLEAEYNDLKTKVDAADEKLKEAEGKVAEFEAADTKREEEAREALEAEAKTFAEGLVKKTESEMKEGAEPAKVERWTKLYLTDKELALEAADSLGLKFEAGEVTGDPQKRPGTNPLEKENPAMIDQLKKFGHSEEDLAKEFKEPEGE